MTAGNQSLIKEMKSLEKLLLEKDKELVQLAESESQLLMHECESLEEELKELAMPPDPQDQENAILEVRSGTGGQEAAHFAKEIFEMYRQFSALKQWRFGSISEQWDQEGGLREGIAFIEGHDAHGDLKFESGVHRVQRVPRTDNSGRIHTSTVTVAVLPETGDLQIHLNDRDLKWEVFRAGGAGGQHVNTTNSAVRVTHVPTGISVSMQDTRCQQQNRTRALKILHSRVYNQTNERLIRERQESRSKLVQRG
jgi:peptide chain release factor 1